MELIEKISAAGVVGAGGAGFPTHVKLKCQAELLCTQRAIITPAAADRSAATGLQIRRV